MAVSDEQEDKLFRLAIYAVTIVIIVFFLTIGSCSMHGQAYESDVEAEKTEQIKAETQLEEARLKALKDLIDSGVNPVAARCAIKGWKGDSAGALCERSATK